jgi:D-glycero-beta-D-manno-heptose-7-phosphate kinase
MTSEQERLLGIIRRFPERRMLVVGDAIADRFIYGAISRISREAPVMILQHEQTETIPGGAANCAVNLASLGAKVSLVSVIGVDEAGDALRQKLEAAGVNCEGVLYSDKLSTTTKVRLLAGQLHSTRQQVIRIDYESKPLSDSDGAQAVLNQTRKLSSESDGIVVSDYNYGVASDQVIEAVRSISKQKSLPIFADSRFRLSAFTGFTSATPNQDEVENLLSKVMTDDGQLSTAAETFRERLGFKALLVTRGSQGMVLFEQDAQPFDIKAVGPSEAVDVTGAGDSVIATYSLAVASGASFADAACLANHAGGLVVMKRGTASVSSRELEQSVLQSIQ